MGGRSRFRAQPRDPTPLYRPSQHRKRQGNVSSRKHRPAAPRPPHKRETRTNTRQNAGCWMPARPRPRAPIIRMDESPAAPPVPGSSIGSLIQICIASRTFRQGNMGPRNPRAPCHERVDAPANSPQSLYPRDFPAGWPMFCLIESEHRRHRTHQGGCTRHSGPTPPQPEQMRQYIREREPNLMNAECTAQLPVACADRCADRTHGQLPHHNALMAARPGPAGRHPQARATCYPLS